MKAHQVLSALVVFDAPTWLINVQHKMQLQYAAGAKGTINEGKDHMPSENSPLMQTSK